MSTNEIRDRILEEARQQGITLTEDELNAKVLEVSQIDPEKLDRVNGGKLFNCDLVRYCWSEYRCSVFSK